MRIRSMLVLVAALTPACGKKTKPLGDKKTACENIYTSYRSHQDKKVWEDACMSAPDETVRCVNLIMDEGKDDACMKAVKSPERTKLVTVLNGTPAAPADPAGSAAAAATGELQPATCPPGFKNADPSFCIMLDKDATPGEPTRYEASGDMSFGRGPKVGWYDASRYDEKLKWMEDILHGMASNKEVRRGDTAGGHGKYILYQSGDHYSVTSVVKGTKWLLTCDVSALDEKSANLTSCETLVVD